MLCCAVLCCAVLCCAVLCCAATTAVDASKSCSLSGHAPAAHVSSMPIIATATEIKLKMLTCPVTCWGRSKQQRARGAIPRAGRPVLTCSPPESASARKPKLRPRPLTLLSRRKKKITPQRTTSSSALQHRWARDCFFGRPQLVVSIISEGQPASQLM